MRDLINCVADAEASTNMETHIYIRFRSKQKYTLIDFPLVNKFEIRETI